MVLRDMYLLEIKPSADRIFAKLAKKDPKRIEIVDKKLSEIRLNQEHSYKFLRKPLQTFNRIHIDSHFVLIFKIDHARKTVVVYHYGHHDEVYDWRG